MNCTANCIRAGMGVTLTAGIWWVARRRCCHGACRWVPTFAAERAELYKIIMQMPSGDDVVLEGCHDRRAVHTSSGGLPADGGAGNALAASFTGGLLHGLVSEKQAGIFFALPGFRGYKQNAAACGLRCRKKHRWCMLADINGGARRVWVRFPERN